MAQKLPGPDAQHRLAPIGRERLDITKIDETKVKKAAVLAAFFNQENRPYLILTERVKYPGVHSGQISFPGGRREKEDADFQETALRETEEEIGVSRNDLEVIGKLSPLYIPPSNFLVHPFVALLKNKPVFTAQQTEVEKILTLDFNRFLDDKSVVEKEIPVRGGSMKVPVFYIENTIVWGATAMMLSELREILMA